MNHRFTASQIRVPDLLGRRVFLGAKGIVMPGRYSSRRRRRRDPPKASDKEQGDPKQHEETASHLLS
ncbi:MAG TPA: hypothetical protein VNL71_13170 [Chloroflexota bacterium]|nr:hypothetical protein [Chloroflexota bacterium]